METQVIVDVRQRQYGIGLRGFALVTENIWSCTGLFGVDEGNGVIFLCHFNTPFCLSTLPEILEELKAHGSDLRNFRVYRVDGISLLTLWSVCLAIAGILFVFGQWWFVGAFCLLPPIFSLTRLRLRFELWRLKSFGLNKPMPLGHSTAWFGFGKQGVRVEFGSGEIPTPYSYGDVRDYERFKEPSIWNFNMTRARGSAVAPIQKATT